MLAARMQADAAEANKTSVLLSYLPNVGFSGAYRVNSATGFTGENTSWLFSFGLAWTLLDGGLREANLREASANVRASAAQAASLALRSREEVRSTQLQLESARANRDKAADQVRLAKENLVLIRVNTAAGVATYLEQEDAIGALDKAELLLIQETLNAQLGVLALEDVAGIYDPQ